MRPLPVRGPSVHDIFPGAGARTRVHGPARTGAGPRRCRFTDSGRRADQQGYGNAPADASGGSFAAASTKGPQGDALHQRRRQQGEALRLSGSLLRAMGAGRRCFEIGVGYPVGKGARCVERLRTRIPIPPRIVEYAPCHDVVIEGDALDVPGCGVERALPVPISTPSWDKRAVTSAPRVSSPKIPDTGLAKRRPLPARR